MIDDQEKRDEEFGRKLPKKKTIFSQRRGLHE